VIYLKLLKRGGKMQKIASRLQNVEPSLIRSFLIKASTLKNQGKDVISLTTGEPDFDTCTTIKEATKQAIDENYTHYGDFRGLLELRQEIAIKIERETGIKYNPVNEILITTGASEAIHHIILSLIDKDDEVIIFTPAFVSYENMIKIAEGKVIDIPLKKESGFQIDLEALEEAITDKTKLVIINSPNNPTGSVYSKEVLTGFCELMVKHDILVFTDEIYNCIAYDQVVYPINAFPGMKERTLYVNGFSKAYAMTGFRVGYIAASQYFIDAFARTHQYTTTCLPTFILVALAKTMNNFEVLEYTEYMRSEFSKRRDLVKTHLDQIDELDYTFPQGAFYYYIDVRKTGLNGLDFCEQLLNTKYVSCVPGIAFGPNYSDYIRISYAIDNTSLEIAFIRIKEFIKQLSI